MSVELSRYDTSKIKEKSEKAKILEGCDDPLQLKIIYIGPSKSGKTESFKRLIERYEDKKISEAYSIQTTEGITMLQDFVTIAFTYYLKGLKYGVVVRIITCAGNERFLNSLKYELPGADGVVFVANSESSKGGQNLRYFREAMLLANPTSTLFAIQLNKRDLSDIVSVHSFKEQLGIPQTNQHIEDPFPLFQTVALLGDNVIACFQDLLLRIVYNQLSQRVGSNDILSFIDSRHLIKLKFDENQDLDYIHRIINDKYKLEKYNTPEPKDYALERFSQDAGFTFSDKEILRSLVKQSEYNFEEPLPWNNEYSEAIKSFGEAVVFLFGMDVEKAYVGRDLKIWNMGFTQLYPNTLNEIRYRKLILEAERRLLLNILQKIKKVLDLNGIECYLDL